MRWALCVLLLLGLNSLVACGASRTALSAQEEPVRVHEQLSIIRVSSYHASVSNLFLALARGDIPNAMYYLSLVTGANVYEQQAILSGLTNLFSE